MLDERETEAGEEERPGSFEIVPMVDHETGITTIKDFGTLKKAVEKLIADNTTFTVPRSAEEYALCKKERTTLNKARKFISDARIAADRNVLADFDGKCKELEKALKEASDAHSDSIHAVEEQMGKAKEKKFVLTITCDDQETADAVAKYAKRKHATVIFG